MLYPVVSISFFFGHFVKFRAAKVVFIIIIDK